MTDRNQIQLTLRVNPEVVAALDALAAREKVSRGKLLRDALDMRLRADAQAQLLSVSILEAVSRETRRMREEAQQTVVDMLDIARATDETHRQLLADFLDALASADGAPAPSSTPKGKDGKVAMPPRPVR